MLNSQSGRSLGAPGALRHANNLIAQLGILVVVSILAMTIGPALHGPAAALSPSHSHVFLTDEAAISHTHDETGDGALDADVVSIGNRSADSAPLTIHLPDDNLASRLIGLITSAQTAIHNSMYADQPPIAPEPPPRLS